MHLEELRIPFVREFRFSPAQLWRFDFAIPDKMIAVEVEGGVWTGGRHVQPLGFIGDCRKYNEATILGWRVLRYTTSMVFTGEAIKGVVRAIKNPSLQ